MTTDGRKIILEPIIEDPFETFERVIGDFMYNREMRKEAEKELLKKALKMLTLDTEIIFVFNPKDKHHKHALNLLEKARAGVLKNIVITNTAILEFVTVLKKGSRAKGFSINDVLLLLVHNVENIGNAQYIYNLGLGATTC